MSPTDQGHAVPAPQDIAEYLASSFPGGKWIAPHWDEGPYWLMPLRTEGLADPHTRALLAAHTPVLTAMPANDITEVFTVLVVSDFVHDALLDRCDPEEGLLILQEHVCGPFDVPPTAGDVVTHLPTLMGLVPAWDGVDLDALERTIEALNGVEPTALLRAVDAVDFSAVTQTLNTAAFLDLLTATAAAVTPLPSVAGPGGAATVHQDHNNQPPGGPMSTDENIAAVEKWLTENLPGGEHILPHWQDGPYWLITVADAEERGTNWQAKLLLAAHTPLVRHLPVASYDELMTCDIYAVSKFVRDTLVWHTEEGGLQTGENPIGPFDERPGAERLLEALPGLIGLDSDIYADVPAADLERARFGIATADPKTFIVALNVETTTYFDESTAAPDELIDAICAAAGVGA